MQMKWKYSVRNKLHTKVIVENRNNEHGQCSVADPWRGGKGPMVHFFGIFLPTVFIRLKFLLYFETDQFHPSNA